MYYAEFISRKKKLNVTKISNKPASGPISDVANRSGRSHVIPWSYIGNEIIIYQHLLDFHQIDD